MPLQVRMLASAAYKASLVEEPLDMNFIRANTLKHQKEMNIDIKSAAEMAGKVASVYKPAG